MKFLNFFEHIVTILWCLQFVPELYRNYFNKLNFSYHLEGNKIYLNFSFPRRFYIKDFFYNNSLSNEIFNHHNNQNSIKYSTHYCLKLDQLSFIDNLKKLKDEHNSSVKFSLNLIDKNSKLITKNFVINLNNKKLTNVLIAKM